MACRAILRRRKIVFDYLNGPVRSVQSFHTLGLERSCRCFDSRGYASIANHISQNSDQVVEIDETSALIKKSPDYSTLAIYRHKSYGITSFSHENRRSGFNSLMDVRLISQLRNYGSTATAKQPDLGSDDEDNEEMAAKRRKEASPEECDQAVVGLSTAKAKAKAKLLQESQSAVIPILKKLWTTLLGIGPALRAVASMSRLDFFIIVHFPHFSVKLIARCPL